MEITEHLLSRDLMYNDYKDLEKLESYIGFTFLKERLKEETLLNPHSIRFYDSHSALWASHRAGIYRQRTEGNVLKAQLVNFHRLTKS